MSATIRPLLRTSLAESVLDDIQTRSSRYYYFLGKTLEYSPFAATDEPLTPVQNYHYELETRNKTITYKQVLPTDACLVVRRINWTSGTVYDQYDDSYQSTTDTGIGNITTLTTDATVSGSGTYFTNELVVGDVIKNTSGTAIGTVASITSDTELELSANAAVAVTSSFYNYTHTVAADSGATALKDSNFYVMTDVYNVYKCISNNYGTASTTKPTGTSTGLTTTADGYVWKYMYNVPASLRNKFLTTAYMPVTTSLRNQFYSAGEITSINIIDGGSGYSASPTLTVTGDGFLADNPRIITGTTITEAGYGYSSAPTLVVSAPTVISGSESTATLSCTIDGDGAVDAVTITDAGYGYESTSPAVTVSEPRAGALDWEELTTYNLSDIVKSGGNYYEVTTGGTTATTAPTHTSGAVTDGTAELTYVATIAEIDTVTTKPEASLSAVVTSGEITDVTINDGGIGYTYATITVTDSTGSGADLTVDLSTGDLDTLQSSVELLAIDGSIDFIKVTNGGSGYSTAPTVAISGDGTGATATANLSAGGAVESITITARGTGYTFATVSFTGGAGSGATARAMMSPVGGHGKHTVDELFAKSLMFYSTISIEKNQDFTVENDYRQIGIVKNPSQYGAITRFKNTLGSACIAVTGSINTANFTDDMQINVTGETDRYIIIAVTTTGALLQSLDNAVPSAGDTFENEDSDQFTVTAVTNPTVDKFSGNLMFIDNRGAFTPTDEQTISARTVIEF